MILFAQDWARYPTAIVDTQTKNRSWVRLASVYREMGIKNHTFLLALVNPALQGIDPHDPELTIEQMAMVGLECKINPWYFFREVARAPGIGTADATLVEANRGNICLWWCFFNHVMIILIQIRQTGKSFSVDELMSLLMNIVCEHTDINLLTKDDTLRRKNVERLKEIMAELPLYLQQRTKDDANNSEQVTVNRLSNTYTTHVPQASPKRAYNMGRGLTTAIFQCDEGPFQPNISIALPAALAAGGAAIDKAKAAGKPYGTILTTTAGKKDDKDGRFIYNLLCDAAVWTEAFFDASGPEQLEELVRKSSRAGKFMINATFNHKQLGKTDAWLKQKLEESLQTGDDANRDYFNMWTSGSQSSPLPLYLLEKVAGSIMEILHTHISNPGNYITRWYIDEAAIPYRMANSKFVLGMDTSEASGGDDISFVLVDVETAEVLAVGTYNETNLIAFAEWVCSFLVQFPNVVANIERRSTGAMLLDYLLLMLPQRGIDPFTRLFNRVVQDYDEFPDRYREIKQPMGRRPQDIYVRYKKTFGFATSSGGVFARSELYSTTLLNACKRGGDKVRDKALIDQITGLINKNGRVDHEDGEHDDLVIGWLLCHWLLTQGKNLIHYGIDIKRVLIDIGPRVEETMEQMYQRIEQDQIRRRIEEVYEQLTNEQDEYVCRKLEHELRTLDKKIVLEADEIYSVDRLIQQAVEAKRDRKRAMQNNVTGVLVAMDNFAQAHRQFDGVFSDQPLNMQDLYRRY